MVIVNKDLVPREIQDDLFSSSRINKNVDLEWVVKKLALNLGGILKYNAHKEFNIEYKGQDDPVTILDKECERIAKEYLLEHHNVNFIGEEYGIEDNNAKSTIIIDPLDGTKSYLKRIFDSSVSIAIEENGELKYGIIYDFMRNNLYTSSSKYGITWLIAGSTAKEISYPINEILIGGKCKKYGPNLKELGIKTKSQEGSIALSMAQTAMGIYSGIAIYNPNKGAIWDVAAGYHLLNCENNFNITDYFGNNFDYKNPQNGLIAINKKLNKQVKEVFLK